MVEAPGGFDRRRIVYSEALRIGPRLETTDRLSLRALRARTPPQGYMTAWRKPSSLAYHVVDWQMSARDDPGVTCPPYFRCKAPRLAARRAEDAGWSHRRKQAAPKSGLRP